MEDLSVVKKLFNALSDLSDDELKRLAELFRYRETSKAFIKMIESKLIFRDVSHWDVTRNSDQRWKRARVGELESRRNGEPDVHFKDGMRSVVSKKILWEGVVSALADRDLFPSTKDVVAVVNSEFNCGIEYDIFYKRGRRDLIGYCMQRLKKLPDKEQYALLKSFFQKITKERSGLNQYRELFRMLTAYE